MRNYPERMRNDGFGYVGVAFTKDSYENASALVVSSLETEEILVMESYLSYYMCLRKRIL